jgi:hypothetical protein
MTLNPSKRKSMWSELINSEGTTNSVIMSNEGLISVAVPEGIKIGAFINGLGPTEHIHVKPGDQVFFRVHNNTKELISIPISYDGATYFLQVRPSNIVMPDSPIIKNPIVENPVIKNPVVENPIVINPIIEETMSHEYPEVNNIFKTAAPMGDGGYGMGGAAALIPLLALTGALGGRRDNNDCGAEKVAVMNAGFDGINHNINNLGVGVNHNINTSMLGLTNQLNTGFNGQRDLDIMQKLGNIEGDIWKAEGQAQLAIAQSTSEINNRIADGLTVAVTGQSAIRKDVSDAIAASLASQAVIRQEVATTAAVNQATTLNAKYELSQNIRDDGDKTRALIVRQYEDTLNRQLAVAQDALLEQRSFARQREVEVNVTQNVNQNQAQLQAQAQQQQQFQVTNNLLQAILCQAQVAQATNQSLIIGNTGAVVGGPQTANPTNVRA